MPWRKPIFPQQLSAGFITSNFARRQRRELGEPLKALSDELQKQYRTIPWNKLEMRDLARMRQINTFDRNAFEQLFTDAREVIDDNCAKLSEQCLQLRDKILEMEKSESDDGKGTKELLIEISEKAELFGQELGKEPLEEHLKELRDQHKASLDKQLEQRFTQFKRNLVQILEKIKKAKEKDFEAGSESTGAVTYGYVGVQPIIKNYIMFLEKGIGSVGADTVRKELEPLTKFSEDKSLFSTTTYNEEFEADMGAIVNDDSSSDDIKKHCITILQALRAIPSRYKD